ncbi:phage integrase N-terminal SAM-like domain-containing protein [Lactiplantibacillus sp. WILCCON 0030]|uniref:Phage integrase N-terminal SAM-like domain-containing protein n=1 Tax=Lactiplantibacillus brownii TaxID=3069269 RepID=A0ABU1A912_9LACO|nr:phage integrase N-terminal SAM-like domain-containing protein [Lactiplantibacillus brownii]MDQ7937404.1 phage integrase N-terminal SAM-like domain-containing protein [Lactiplantibacillus brownii]
MTSQFPYKKSFVQQLQADGKQPQTINQYQLTLADFFQYEQHFNPTYHASGLIADITENDIKAYLAMLRDRREFKTSTINKSLSNLNGYFSFLFAYRTITTLPTFAIKGQPVGAEQPVDDWPVQLPDLLTNADLHVYTRAFLLFTCKSYTASEILAPNFYQQLNHLTFSTNEQVFLTTFSDFLVPLQSEFDTKDLFLKQRKRGDDPHLSLAALHKYLTGDSQRAGLPLTPVLLRQSFVLWFLREHRATDLASVMHDLRLDLTSLGYYQNLLRKQDLQRLRANKLS